jgi:PAS domain S-box-containing protein
MISSETASVNKPIRILHLEDVLSDAELIKREMTKSSIAFEWQLTSTKNEFKQALVDFVPDIILSDHTLRGFTSTEALGLAKEVGIKVPFILVTATVSEEFAASLIRLGISDYLLKDRLQRLPNAIVGAVEKYNREKEKEEYVAKIIQSENRFRSLIENSNDMLTLFDATRHIHYISPSVKRKLGYTSEIDYPKKVTDGIHRDDLMRVEELITEASENPGLPLFDIFRNRKKDGDYLWVEGTITNLLHVEGVNAFVFNYRDITERKQAEDTILKSKANLNAIIENSDVNIFSLDKDFKYLTFNSLHKNTLKKIYGLDINIGDNVYDFLEKLDPKEAQDWQDVYTEALSGKSLKFEKEFNIGDYHSYSSFSLNPIWENQDVIGLSCFAQDVTEQRLAQKKLRQSEERYRNIVETAQEGIWIVDENEKTSFVNKKLCELFEYTADEILGQPLYRFMDKERIDTGMQWETAQVNEPWDVGFITKTGKTLWTNLSASALLDNEGKYIGVLAMVTDITKKKRFEESLKKSEANIRNIFDNTHVGYTLLDTNFSIVSFNQVASTLYEAQLGAALKQGTNLLDYFKGERKTRLEQQYKEVLKGSRINYETYFHQSDGTTTWYDIQLSPVFDAEKKLLLGLVVAVTDITTLKDSQLQREKITADLIQRNKDLEQFAYIVSHNLRAPVANILGISNVLAYPGLSDDQRKDLGKGISSSAQKLDDVIIDLNHILQTKREINERKEQVRFSALVSDIKISIADLIEKSNVVITTCFENIDEIFTLKSYLYSVFYNLISNSIKYRQADVAPIITIKSSQFKNKITLVFADNGRGIDLQRHGEKIFGLYKRFHSLDTEGKGMGLYMVKTQVETLGGTIAVTSEVNKGTEFKIEFDPC